MRTKWLRSILQPMAAMLLATLVFCCSGFAQQVSLALLTPEAIEPAAPVKVVQKTAPPDAPGDHRFWDRENSFLFGANAAFGAADFVVTKDNLRNGGQEFNPVTRVFGRGTAALAVNFAGETAGVVGISYLLHRTGHHKMERAVSMLNLGGSAAAVSFDLAHR